MSARYYTVPTRLMTAALRGRSSVRLSWRGDAHRARTSLDGKLCLVRVEADDAPDEWLTLARSLRSGVTYIGGEAEARALGTSPAWEVPEDE